MRLLYVGLAIVMTVTGCGMAGDGLSDAAARDAMAIGDGSSDGGVYVAIVISDDASGGGVDDLMRTPTGNDPPPSVERPNRGRLSFASDGHERVYGTEVTLST